MNLNFKKNNLLIIMLLIFVILSCIIFVNMSNVKESFDNINTNSRYFLDTTIDSSYNYYKLDTRRFKYKLTTLPTGLILENSNNLTSTNTLLQSRDLRNYREKGILLMYYNTETDISLLNINANTTIMLDINTVLPTDPSNSKTMDMVFIENSGNFYDFSNQKLSKFSIKINGENVIVNGEIFQPRTPPREISSNVLNTTNNNRNNSNFYNDFNLYLLRQGAFGSNYIPPIYNNFETAMNLPSNPIVNPINTMNPLDYANTLFGPNITPTMISNMCLNQNVAKVTDNNRIIREVSNNLLPNLGNNNINKSNNANNSKNLNSSNDYNNINRNQNFMRETPPPYQRQEIFSDSIQKNSDPEFIPRPVLTDFSSFGM